MIKPQHIALIVLPLLSSYTHAQESRWVPLSAHSKFIVAMAEDQNNNLWLSGEEKGIASYDGTKWTIYDESNTKGILDNFCYAIAVDKHGSIWCGTGRKGVAVFDGKTWKKYDIHDGLSGMHVYSIATDPKDGKVWIGTEGGLSVWDGRVFANYTRDKDGLCSNQIVSIVIDQHAGTIWIGGSENGISRFNDNRWKTFASSNSPLVSDQVNSLFLDSRRHLWVATHGGLTRINISANTWTTHKIPLDKTDHYYTSITEDARGNMWISTRKDGVWMYNANTSQWKSYDKSSGLPDNYVWCLTTRHDGTILSGTYGGSAAALLPALR